MSHYQLVVFDWDGTLMDSTAHIVNCMRQAIEALQLPPLPDAKLSHIIGLGLQEAVQTLYPEANATLWQALADRYRSIWLSSPTDTPLFANARTLLDRLVERDVLLAVATGKGRRGLDKVLTATGLNDRFVATRCADESFSKPHPQMLLELMDYCGVNANETLMIGDTEFDMLMAKNAGTDRLAVSYGAHDKATLLATEPLALLDDLYQVEHWLNPRVLSKV